MSSYEFETHEPVDLYVELGKGSLNVTATDTTATTVEVVGRDAEEVMVRQDGKQISVVAPKGNRGLFGGEHVVRRDDQPADPLQRRGQDRQRRHRLRRGLSAPARSAAGPATAGSTPSTAR